jgi:recombining binding protein suppressor of hairless
MHALQQPDPRTAKMLTLYGENFDKGDPIHVYFGSEPSSHVEVRCTEVVGCLPPEGPVTKRQPILLVRGDGVVYPTGTSYP